MIPPAFPDSFDDQSFICWLQQARAWNPTDSPTWIAFLRSEGLNIPDSARIAEDDIGRYLRRLILALAERGLYLVHTDHLTDRALYEYLINAALAAPRPPRSDGQVELIDLCPPYGEGLERILASYASDEVRQTLQNRHIPVPPRVELAADRDHSLPHPPELEPHNGPPVA
jgi:hypothetical protein